MTEPNQSKRTSGFKVITQEWQIFLVALQFLTRIPITLKQYQPDWLHQSSRHFAGVGLLIGIMCGLVFFGLSLLFTPLVVRRLALSLQALFMKMDLQIPVMGLAAV